mgnify:CR=1 FL=1
MKLVVKYGTLRSYDLGAINRDYGDESAVTAGEGRDIYNLVRVFWEKEQKELVVLKDKILTGQKEW